MAWAYWRISSKIWSERWSEDAKLLAVYILTNEHRIPEGLYRLPKVYICHNLRWSAQRLAKPFGELLREGFIDYDETAEMVLIVKALKHQAPQNPNQVKHALADLEMLPETPLFAGLLQGAELFAKPFAERLRERFPERLGKPYAKQALALALSLAATETERKSPSCSPPTELREGFEKWWKIYGAHGGKEDARRCYEHWRTQGASAEELERAAGNYRLACERADRIMKDGSTFLAKKAGRWQEWLTRTELAVSGTRGGRTPGLSAGAIMALTSEEEPVI